MSSLSCRARGTGIGAASYLVVLETRHARSSLQRWHRNERRTFKDPGDSVISRAADLDVGERRGASRDCRGKAVDADGLTGVLVVKEATDVGSNHLLDHLVHCSVSHCTGRPKLLEAIRGPMVDRHGKEPSRRVVVDSSDCLTISEVGDVTIVPSSWSCRTQRGHSQVHVDSAPPLSESSSGTQRKSD
jgi:hypothetical protein